MSIELSSHPQGARGNPPQDPWAVWPGGGQTRGLRRQAAQIIAAVLSDATPQQARARAQLRRCVKAYPGRPEVALAAHLIALREESAAAEPPQPSGPGAEAPPAARQNAHLPILHQRPTLRVHYGRPDRSAPGGTALDGN